MSLWSFLSPLITKVLFIVAPVFLPLCLCFSSHCQNMNYISHYLVFSHMQVYVLQLLVFLHYGGSCFCASFIPHKNHCAFPSRQLILYKPKFKHTATFCIDIHGPQRMSPNDLPDFPRCATMRLTFVGGSEISQ